MARTYTELFYHFVWTTKLREPYITPEVESPLYRGILAKCAEMGSEVHAIGEIEDHVHLVCSVPPKISLSFFMEKVKGSTSHLVNHLQEADLTLYWQPGYGALTFGKRDLKRIVAYVQNQKLHHTSGTVQRQSGESL